MGIPLIAETVGQNLNKRSIACARQSCSDARYGLAFLASKRKQEFMMRCIGDLDWAHENLAEAVNSFEDELFDASDSNDPELIAAHDQCYYRLLKFKAQLDDAMSSSMGPLHAFASHLISQGFLYMAWDLFYPEIFDPQFVKDVESYLSSESDVI